MEEEPIHTICANFLDGGLVQKRPIILACPVCGLYNGFYGVERCARWQGCCAVWWYKDAVLCVAIQSDVNFVLGCVCETLGFTEWDALHTILVSQKLVPHWYTNEYKNTLITSMLFFILYWQIKFLDGRASTESLASMF